MAVNASSVVEMALLRKENECLMKELASWKNECFGLNTTVHNLQKELNEMNSLKARYSDASKLSSASIGMIHLIDYRKYAKIDNYHSTSSFVDVSTSSSASESTSAGD